MMNDIKNIYRKVDIYILIIACVCILIASGEAHYYKYKCKELQETVDRQASAIEMLEKQNTNY